MKTYKDFVSEIESLSKEAEKVRKQELQQVIIEVRSLIKDYALTAEQLGLSTNGLKHSSRNTKPGKVSSKRRKPAATSKATKRIVAPKYRDTAGNSWTGRGKQPKWLVAALAGGASIDSFKIEN